MGFKTGMFKYFNELDEDCSGFLEPDEITSLALKFFGEHKQKACEEYVERVFREYDVDESGELSYEEAREFLKGIMAFLDSTGELTDEARAAFMEAMVEEESDEEEEPEPEAEPVNDGGDGKTDIGNGDITDNNNNGEQVIEETIEAKNESVATKEQANEKVTAAGKPASETQKSTEGISEKNSEQQKVDDNYTPPKSEYKVPEAKVMIDPIPTGPDGKPRLGRFGELLDEDGVQILVNPGVIIGPDGKQLLLQKGEIRNPHDGEAFVGKYGEILDVEANAIVQQFNNIQNPKGEAIMGHLIRGTEETKLTSAGGLLDPNGQPILGPKPSPGCLLDQNGKPIKPYLNKYGELMDTGDGGDNSGSKFTVGQGMGDTGYSGSGGASRPDFQYQRPAETNTQKSNLRKAIAKKWEIKKPEGHDGFCPLLRIYRPRTSMKKKEELLNLPDKVRRFKWVRDPISDQWIHVERIGEEARAA